MAYDIQHAIYENKSFDPTAQASPVGSVFFKPDGSKLYVVDSTSAFIYQYSLSTEWDISTASYDSKSADLTGQIVTFLKDIFIRSDGKKLYALDSPLNEVIYQYTLSTAWDISTLSYDTVNLDVGAVADTPNGVFFKPDGTKLYITDDTTNAIFQYSLSTAWDISTGTYDSLTLSIGSYDTHPQDVCLNSNGTKLFFNGTTTDRIYQFSLPTAWSISGAVYDNVSFYVGNQELTPVSIVFNSDGSKLYVSGEASNKVYQYDSLFPSERPVRKPTASMLVSWKRDFDPAIVFFTIGVSSIGGTDIIPGEAGIAAAWTKYLYYDESDYLLDLDWERQLKMPQGGLSVALADGTLDNTSGRFTPRYLGGSSELFTAILPRRPFILNAGFNYQGVDENEAEFVGVFTRQPEVDLRSKTLRWQGADFNEFLSSKFVDNTVMFTSQRTDQLLETIIQSTLGYSTAEYDLDTGINVIPFAIFERGQKYSNIVDELVQSEYGHFYQDEEGKLRFENRQHWDNPPHNSISLVLHTAQVIEARSPDEDHIINVVEVKSQSRSKQPEQVIFQLNTFDSIEIPASSTGNEIFVDFEDPVLSVTTPSGSGTTSYFKAFSNSDGTGTNLTSSISITRIDRFANAAKLIISNSSSQTVFLTELVITGRPAKVERDIYYRDQDDSSVTAYDERVYTIENKYIQNTDWAQSLSRLILNDFAEIENLQTVVIKAIPSMKLGDLISWQGRYWRVFGIKTALSASEGFVQELTLLQRQITSYFRIGISTIGSTTDSIAP